MVDSGEWAGFVIILRPPGESTVRIFGTRVDRRRRVNVLGMVGRRVKLDIHVHTVKRKIKFIVIILNPLTRCSMDLYYTETDTNTTQE